MHKDSLNFIKDLVDKEYNLFQEGIYESIIANKYGQNLFCIFKSKEEVEEYILQDGELQLSDTCVDERIFRNPENTEKNPENSFKKPKKYYNLQKLLGE